MTKNQLLFETRMLLLLFTGIASAQDDPKCALVELGLGIAAAAQKSPCFDELSHNCTSCTVLNPDCAFCPDVNIAVSGVVEVCGVAVSG
jgi:hypothetical protein